MIENLSETPKYSFSVSEEDIGLRLDAFLSKNLPQISRAKIQKLISSGFVFLHDSKILKSSNKISSISEKYSVFEEKEEVLLQKLSEIDKKKSALNDKYDFSKMIYEFEDDDIILINKPAGLICQDKPGEKNDETSVSQIAKSYIEAKSKKVSLSKSSSISESGHIKTNHISENFSEQNIDQQSYLSNELLHQIKTSLSQEKINDSSEKTNFDWQKGREFLVHRLDKETSGLMVLSKTPDAYNFLKNEFLNRRVKKKYKGVVWGVPNPKIHKMFNEIRRDNINRTKMIIVTNRKILNSNQSSVDDQHSCQYQKTKTAITSYKVEKVLFNGAMSLVEFEIETGRTHQIRAQMSFIGHPIVFDFMYGGGLEEKAFMIKRFNQNYTKILENLKNFDRHLLHSWSLSFFHPKTNDFLEFDTDDDYSKEINMILEMNINDE